MLFTVQSKLKIALPISLLVAVLISFAFQQGIFSSWQAKLTDSFYYEQKPLNDILLLTIDDHALQDIGRWPWKREVYINLLQKLSTAKVIGFDIAFFEAYDPEIDKEVAATMANVSVIIPSQYTDYQINGDTILGTELLLPTKAYQNISHGFVNIFSDADGITRSLPTQVSGKFAEEGFALRVAEAFRGRDIESDSSLIINFIGPPHSFQEQSLSTCLQSNSVLLNNTSLRGKIVLIGATAPGLHDEYFVPFSESGAMSGIEINANAIQTLLTQRFLQTQGAFSTFALIFLMSFLSGIIAALFRLRFALPFLFLLFLSLFFYRISHLAEA